MRRFLAHTGGVALRGAQGSTPGLLLFEPIRVQDGLFIKLYGDLPKKLLFQRELLILRL